jgi:hypothetical protein
LVAVLLLASELLRCCSAAARLLLLMLLLFLGPHALLIELEKLQPRLQLGQKCAAR